MTERAGIKSRANMATEILLHLLHSACQLHELIACICECSSSDFKHLPKILLCPNPPPVCHCCCTAAAAPWRWPLCPARCLRHLVTSLQLKISTCL